MEREVNNQLVFIEYDMANKADEVDVRFLSEYFREIEMDGNNTFYTIINYDPTVEILTKSYSIPRLYRSRPSENEKNTEYDLSEYLSIDEIQNLHCFEYEDEKVYSLINQEIMEDDLDTWDSDKVYLLTSRLLKYLENRTLINFHNETIKELNEVNKMSKVAVKYNAKLRVYDDYFWGDMYL